MPFNVRETFMNYLPAGAQNVRVIRPNNIKDFVVICEKNEPIPGNEDRMKYYAFGVAARATRNFAFRHYFLSAKTREEFVTKWVARRQERKETKQRTNFDNTNVQVGQVFYTSWGYNMTTVTFFEVVGKVGKATVEIREIRKNRMVDGTGGGGTAVPQEPREYIGEVERKRVATYDDAPIIVNADYNHPGWVWDGRPKGETYYD